MTLQDPIVWLDLETDGTSRPEEGRTLEIGIVLTDGFDRHVDELNIVINPGRDPQGVWDSMDPVVQRMHTGTGLWEECLGSEHDEWGAETLVLRFLDSYGLPSLTQPGENLVTWGGKGVSHFDGPWMERRMRRLHGSLRYWAYDVSPVRRLGKLVGIDEPEFFQTGETQHRAIDDARNAWRAAKWWRDTLYASKNPGQLPRMEKRVKINGD